ncbi:PREDICTED: uncharacterized protein LOC109418593 [Paramuricea clavata]|uniref:PREDICTED: uncharacterized protein LOC109418593 n=1 Tax=Paramuricea clavata TaxID=317549 RepID=A0A7D9IKL4_PARCT|nr:PREDICTED: uncharacterized protein LOC109418593 [Paramuricea clavata]
MAEENEVVQPGNTDGNKLFHSSLRRPDKFKIGDDFDLFIKKLELYFEAVELVDEKKRRFALLFNLNEDAFCLAESVEFIEGADAYKNWLKKLKLLFERNQTPTEKRYNGVEAGAKCGFRGDEYASRLVDQFILGLRDRTTQSKLLQEPPSNLDDALLIARRFEAANATMQILAMQGQGTGNNSVIGAPGHIARNCFISKPGQGDVQNSQGKHVANRKSLVCYRCGKEGHIATFYRTVLDDTKEAVQSQDQRLNNQQNRTCMQNETQSKIRLSTISPASKRKTLMVEA